MLRGMKFSPACGLEIVFARNAQGPSFVELACANSDEIEVFLGGAGIGISNLQRPAGQTGVATRHANYRGVEAHTRHQSMVFGVVGQISMNLRPIRPFRVGVRHWLVGISIEIFGALGLHFGIGTCGLPDTTKIAATFEYSYIVPARFEYLCCVKACNACAADANILLLDHDPLLIRMQRHRLPRETFERYIHANLTGKGYCAHRLVAPVFGHDPVGESNPWIEAARIESVLPWCFPATIWEGQPKVRGWKIPVIAGFEWCRLSASLRLPDSNRLISFASESSLYHRA